MRRCVFLFSEVFFQFEEEKISECYKQTGGNLHHGFVPVSYAYFYNCEKWNSFSELSHAILAVAHRLAGLSQLRVLLQRYCHQMEIQFSLSA